MTICNVNSPHCSRYVDLRSGLVRLAGALVPLLIVAGCSTAPTQGDHRAAAVTRTKPATSANNTPAMPAAGSGRGGYYKDDGPGDNIPDGLENVANAIPTVEPYSRTGNKPYVVFGKTYTPLIDNKPFMQRGIGSWYGKKFHKQRTSSGEPYDMYKMTAAHPTLPIPSYARVTNLKSGKQVIVRINDRGPFHSSRIIDLSYTAALKLGYLGKGSGELEVERLLPADIVAMNQPGNTVADRTGSSTPAAMSVDSPTIESTLLALDSPQSASPVSQSLPTTSTSTSQDVKRADDTIKPDVNSLPAATTPAASGFYLQLGAFSQQLNAGLARKKLLDQFPGVVTAVQDVEIGGVYRLYAGPFANRSDAENAASLVRSRGIVNPIIVMR
ncbi:septal ring lytic transglycosylase RlpA family protein [Glaciimonas immobilis]|uniref:Endolytic peptidoglycan transglycosylase RlpA n=1 Tax=Glaciimonas immobilis TaxID=728004 RepID=A0A840RXC3_9BURK|nr:septal ring lytic transglycosylase RlpA family protein [Glaciimonas immobilis]KAF3997196.1 septal ring lytic transglycosylase RlpA family protein [Glaciimonas immobilis]MBB5202233.1 rare lipoprotein A [Glaciimonas immobilis]